MISKDRKKKQLRRSQLSRLLMFAWLFVFLVVGEKKNTLTLVLGWSDRNNRLENTHMWI
jgi:hypothetical protein